MNWIHALILAIVQGATEFFPVSSSAHLKLVKLLFGIQETHQLFNLCCHLGTLLALLLVFRKKLLELFSWSFILALLPLIPGYLLFHDLLTAPIFLGCFLLVTSALLFCAGKSSVTERKRPLRDALCIGAAQTLALFPGLSRSASTICCARFLGWEPQKSVHFSFLLSIPTILGGSALECLRLFFSKDPVEIALLPCAVGFAASFAVGSFFVRFSLRLLENGVLKPFAWYCLVIGAFVLYLFHG
jgi:undecaprenyl-diphosphatase